MSKIRYIIDYIGNRHAIHFKRLNKILPGLDATYHQRAEYFLVCYEKLLSEEGKNLDFAIDCYLKMIADVASETLRFRETGRYTSTSFAEVNKRVYGNPAVMEYYMHALLLSQFLWHHHYLMFCFFCGELEKRSLHIKRYLEIGGGHGLQVSHALKTLPPGTSLTVVDISETSLAIARRLVADNRVQFIQSDIFKYQPVAKFDFITMGEVLEHMEDPQGLLECVAKLLNDGGTLFITTPTNAPAIDHIHLFHSAEEIRQMIQRAGFAVVSEFARYAEDVDEETAERLKITLHYGACLKKSLQTKS